jgi:hypothetical protein
VLAICGLAAFALLTAPAIAKNPAKNTKPANTGKPVKGAPVVPGSRYLALGDSVRRSVTKSRPWFRLLTIPTRPAS